MIICSYIYIYTYIYIFILVSISTYFIYLFIYIMKKLQNQQRHAFYIYFCLVADLFNLAGDGDGGRGTILGSTIPSNYVLQPQINFLEMAHTFFSLLFEKTASQPLI